MLWKYPHNISYTGTNSFDRNHTGSSESSHPNFALAFLYMPWMHSEKREDHERAEQLFSQPGLEKNYEFELAHKRIIDRFGRYPHRNAILGRQSTPEEISFLEEDGSSF